MTKTQLGVSLSLLCLTTFACDEASKPSFDELRTQETALSGGGRRRPTLRCNEVSIAVDATAAATGQPLQGTALHTYDDGREAAAALTVAFNRPPEPFGEGSKINATNTYVFADGTIEGLNLALRLPRQADGVSEVVGTVEYVMGTGAYRRVAGLLRFEGTVRDEGDVFDGRLQGHAFGVLCAAAVT